MPQKKSSKLPLKKFAMVGTGIQGTQVAMIAARTGYDVTVFDPARAPSARPSRRSAPTSRPRR